MERSGSELGSTSFSVCITSFLTVFSQEIEEVATYVSEAGVLKDINGGQKVRSNGDVCLFESSNGESCFISL